MKCLSRKVAFVLLGVSFYWILFEVNTRIGSISVVRPVESTTKFSKQWNISWELWCNPPPYSLINLCRTAQINHLSLHLDGGLFGGLPDYICLEHRPSFYWYLTKISFKLMINLCNPACILKMACLSLPQPHKRDAALSFREN